MLHLDSCYLVMYFEHITMNEQDLSSFIHKVE